MPSSPIQLPKPKFLYCDACVFLAYFRHENGRGQTLETLFEQIHKDRTRKLLTSTLTMVEVSQAVATQNPNDILALDDFWNEKALLEFIDVSEIIARRARDLIREAVALDVILKGFEAMHLASAMVGGAEIFYTYHDVELLPLAQLTGLKIVPPFTPQPKLL